MKRVFERCHIYGPALLQLTGSTEFAEITFDEPKEAVQVITKNAHPIGAIEVFDCRFLHCHFHGVGMIGLKEAFEGWGVTPAL